MRKPKPKKKPTKQPVGYGDPTGDRFIALTTLQIRGAAILCALDGNGVVWQYSYHEKGWGAMPMTRLETLPIYEKKPEPEAPSA